MNFNKTSFTAWQLMAVPEFRTSSHAPIGEPFFLLQRHIQQKDQIVNMIKETGWDKLGEVLDKTKAQIHIEYWIKRKDGNVQTAGAHLVSGGDQPIESIEMRNAW